MILDHIFSDLPHLWYRYDGLRPDFGNQACFFDKDNSLANFVFFHALLIVIQVSSNFLLRGLHI